MPRALFVLLSIISLVLAAPLIAPLLRFQTPLLPTSSSSSSSSANRVKVTLGVMSRCPDAVFCENLFDGVLGERGDRVEMGFVYIGSPDSDSPSGTHCLHGDIECTGNIQQLCAAKHFSNIPALVGAERNRLWEFVQCQNRGGIRAGVDGVARSCAEEVGEAYEGAMEDCVNGQEGKQLLTASTEESRRLEVQKSCTMLISDRKVCVHDGIYKECEGGHEISDFVRQIDTEYERINQ